MTILCIDTATKVCSAALWSNGKVVAHKIYDGEANHARALPMYIDELLAIARERSLHIDAVALSEGPGSYTGLRIGAGTAKGLCYALDIPLIPIPTTEVMCQGLKELKSERVKDDTALCPLIDARRMEVYAAYYTRDIRPLTDIRAIVVDSPEALTQPIKTYAKHVIYFGDGADKCRDLLATATDIQCDVVSGIVPDAQFMGELVERREPRGENRKVEDKDLAYYEPFYLKEFVAAPSHVKGLR